MAGTEVVFETSVNSPFNQLMQLLAREYFTDFSPCEIFKLYVRSALRNKYRQDWNQIPAEVLGNLPCKLNTLKKRVRKVIIEVS
jgi:hypothetical protein